MSDHQQVMNCIWVITVTDEEMETVSHGTGVSVGPNRILTCLHVTDVKYPTGDILARRHTEQRSYNLLIVHSRPKWDLILLKFENEDDFQFDYLRISDNEFLDIGDQLFHIGHPDDFAGHFMTGLVVYPCIKIDPNSFKYSYLTCETHEPDFHVHREYSILGDILNKGTPIEKYDADNADADADYEHKADAFGGLCPLLPVISCSGMGKKGRNKGCSGGPLFREDGKVVGIVHGWYKFTFGFHVSVLKEFLREAGEVDS